MPRTLRNLILASGNAGTSGQSFRNHVTGATSGTKMSDYNLGSASFTNQPVDDVGNYPDQYDAVITVTFAGVGGKFDLIKRSFTDAANWNVSVIGGLGASVAIQSLTSSGPTNAVITTRIRSPFRTDGSLFGSAAFANGTQSLGDPEPILITGSASNPGAAAASTVQGFISYFPDNGPYNPTITNGSGWSAPFSHRALDATAFSWEWYTSTSDRSSSTNMLSNSRTFTLTTQVPPLAQSGGTVPLDSFTLYFRTRTLAGGEFSLGSVSWTDPRPAV